MVVNKTMDAKGLVTDPKTVKSRRRVDMSPQLVEVLRAHKKTKWQESVSNNESVPENVFKFTRTGIHAALKRCLELAELKRVLGPGGTITIIEGDHGSFYCYPETPEARKTVRCLIDVQAALGGNALVGRELYPLMKKAGFEDIHVTPRIVYVDQSRPEWEEGFSKNSC